MRHVSLAVLGGLAATGAVLVAGGPWWAVALAYVAGSNLVLMASAILGVVAAGLDALVEREARVTRLPSSVAFAAVPTRDARRGY